MRIRAIGRRWRWAFALIAALATGVAYAGQGQAAAPAAPKFSAVELANAILFDDGPAAGYLKDLGRPQVEWTDDTTRSEKAIDAAVSADPKWAASFASRVQSGDPNQIQAAVNDLAGVSYNVAEGMFGKEAVAKALTTTVGSDDASSVGLWYVVYRFVYVYRYVFFIRYFFVIWDRYTDVRQLPKLVDELTVRTIAVNLSTKAVG